MPTKIAAQPSKYQCDGNDEHDAGGNHQDFEGVIARHVIVGTLYALHGHDRTPCQQTPVYTLASYLRGNARRRIPHRVFLGRRSAAQRFLLCFRAANHKRCDAMGSAAGKLLVAC
jgi:hypothetical protein